MTPTLAQSAANYIDGSFQPLTGEEIVSVNPARPGEIIWQGAADVSHIDKAVDAARRALPDWANRSFDERVDALRRWQSVVQKHAERIAKLITDETGKTLAEGRAEAKLLSSKVDITLGDESMRRVREYEVNVTETRSGRCRFKPHGVMAIIGPFNFPAHLPNGHWVPAMLTGNTIVFKPSEKTPAVGQLVAELMDEAEIPPGVFNVVQGAGDIAAQLVDHNDIDGILFTGSWPVGRRILETNLDRSGRIIALEMGGNNPAVIMPDAPLKQAVLECVRAGFATTGQRCTCTRRVIVHADIAERVIALFAKVTSMLVVGPGDADEPVFMGPIITDQARRNVLDFQNDLVKDGGRLIVEAAAPEDTDGYFITPGIVEVDGFDREHDCEVFGPLVQVCVVNSLDEAIKQANATQYGLAASIFTSDEATFDTFFRDVNAGIINWNVGTAGASSKLPFGGVGHSGNHRPAGVFAMDYCAYPIANMIEQSRDVAVPDGVPWDDRWVE